MHHVLLVVLQSSSEEHLLGEMNMLIQRSKEALPR